MVRYWRRDFAAAVTLGRRGVELHPYLHVVRANYAQALEFASRPDLAIAQYRLASSISPDVPWLRALEGACQATLGRQRDAGAVLEELEALRRIDYVDAYHMAALRLALEQRREALTELERACAENSAWMYTLDVDPRFDRLRPEPEFRRLKRRPRDEAADAAVSTVGDAVGESGGSPSRMAPTHTGPPGCRSAHGAARAPNPALEDCTSFPNQGPPRCLSST